MKSLIILCLASFALAEIHKYYDDYNNHHCKRNCSSNDVEICYYKLAVEFMMTLDNNCMNCLKGVPEDCFNPECIIADNRSKVITTFNRMMPGPQIEVCQNDEVMVDVTNSLCEASTTIHWHGMKQKESPHMDGVPMITQCPIHGSFRYHFIATEAGTHFYHSHSGTQRADGAYGTLIVRQSDSKNLQRKLYDYDLSEHVMVIADWFYEASFTHLLRNLRERTIYLDMIASLLINGRSTTATSKVPPIKFVVEKGKRYRFRVIHAGSRSCPLDLSIDGHKLEIISSDGNDIKPLLVDTLTLTNGERYDFVLHADKETSSYGIKLKGNTQCEDRYTYAVLEYKGASSKEIDFVSLEKNTDQGLIMNAVNPINISNTYTARNITSMQKVSKQIIGKPDFKYVIDFDVFIHPRQMYRGVGEENFICPHLNKIVNIMPSVPLLQSPPNRFCNRENMNKSYCKEDFCECLHIVEIPLNSMVELILVDEGKIAPLTHPLHLHGHSFYVIAQEMLGGDVNRERIEEMDRNGELPRNLQDPPNKDVVSVHAAGYTIIRFVADNPGYWLFHCHVEFHMEEGMQLIFKVGKDMPKLPKNFPKCGDYLESNKFKKSKNSSSKEEGFKLFSLITNLADFVSNLFVF